MRPEVCIPPAVDARMRNWARVYGTGGCAVGWGISPTLAVMVMLAREKGGPSALPFGPGTGEPDRRDADRVNALLASPSLSLLQRACLVARYLRNRSDGMVAREIGVPFRVYARAVNAAARWMETQGS